MPKREMTPEKLTELKKLYKATLAELRPLQKLNITRFFAAELQMRDQKAVAEDNAAYMDSQIPWSTEMGEDRDVSHSRGGD